MRMFGSTIGALRVAREDGLNVWDTLDTGIGWNRLLGAEGEATAIADMAPGEPLIRAAGRYLTLSVMRPPFPTRSGSRRPVRAIACSARSGSFAS